MGDWFCSANCLFGRVYYVRRSKTSVLRGWVSILHYEEKSLRSGSIKLLERSPKNMKLAMKR